jgi:hypothetical protein
MTDTTTTNGEDTAGKRKVKVLAFTYAKVYDNPYDPDGPKIVEAAIAQRGDLVDWDELTPYDQERADKFEVFYDEGEPELEVQPDGTLAPAEEPDEESGSADGEDIALGPNSSVQDLTEWIRDDQPTVTEVVELADGDPAMAQKLLDAENAATGGDPRKGVVDGLNKIIAAG